MKLNRMSMSLFGNLLLVPLLLRAQTDPNAMPTGSQPMSQPGTASHSSAPGTVSGNTLATQDSSLNGGGAEASRMKDRMFLRKASEGGMAEVQMGQLAAEKAGSEDVKEFGQKMVEDHTSLNNQLGPLAQEMGLKAPARLNKVDQAEYDKLNSLSGAEFDREYLTAMTRDHRKDVREFRQEEASTTDAALKDAVAHGEKIIAGHLRMIEKLDAANGVASTPH